MARFLVRRLFSIFISIIGATMVIFILTRLGPDPIDLYLGDAQVDVTPEFLEMLRAELGLDKSLPEQYGIWLLNIAQLDMGYSIGTQRLVKDIIAIHIGTTLKLAAGAWIFAVSIGVSVGVLAAVKRATVWAYICAFWTGNSPVLDWSYGNFDICCHFGLVSSWYLRKTGRKLFLMEEFTALDSPMDSIGLAGRRRDNEAYSLVHAGDT